MIKRFYSTIMKTPIIITSNAWNKMNEISNKQDIKTFIFKATSGGCNGFNYKLELINNINYEKIIHTQSTNIKPTILSNNNVKLLIDPISEFLLFGTTIDYIKEDYSNGIFENKFLFIPDKSLASSCGCGISFTPTIKI